MDRDETNFFLQKFAHELRNPLAPISNALQIMELMKLGDNVESLRKIMVRQVDKLCNLVDVLSDVSRINAGSFEVTKDIVSLSQIIDLAIESTAALFDESGHALTVKMPEFAVYVSADVPRLSRTISTLLDNASKNSEPNLPIELAVLIDGDTVEIVVSDEGVGISPARINAIFEMFSHRENANQHCAPGLGVRLAISRAIVELHGGTIIAASDGDGKGSKFTIRIPLAEPQERSLGVKYINEQHPNYQSLRVLIVDDMQPLRRLLAKLVEKLGHTVELANSGEQAMEMIEKFLPQVIFSDISMPGMSGYDLVQVIRKRPDMKTVCMVAMTGNSQDFERKLAFELGFDAYLTKPVDFKQLKTLFSDLPR